MLQNYSNMANLNRIKVVLVERVRLASGLLKKLAKHHALLASGAVTAFNLIWPRLIRLQNSLTLT